MKNIRNIFSAYFTFRSSIKNDKQTKKGKEINIFKLLARSNVFWNKIQRTRSKFGVA
jgi:hypothetical protein